MIRVLVVFVVILITLLQAIVEFGDNPTLVYVELSAIVILINFIYDFHQTKREKGG